MKRIFALFLTLVMLLSLCACGGNGNEGTKQNELNGSTGEEQDAAVITGTANDLVYLDGYWPDEYLRDTITVATSRDGGGFAPVGNASWGSVDMCIYEKLMVIDSEGENHLQLLKSITEVDELTYECEIWDCIYDTAGNHITAADVKWSIQLFIESGQKGGVNCLNLLEGDIADIDVTGEYTFTWHCSKAFGPGEMGKNFSNPTIISQKGYEASGEDMYLTNPIGTGPYMLESYTVGSRAVFVANPNYWMKNITDEAWLAENFYACNSQNVRCIVYDIIQDAATRAMALEMGDVCAIDTANAADIDAYINNPSYGISPVRKRVGAPLAFYFNCSEESPCSDINLRMAICYAVDSAAIAAGISYPAYPVYGLQPNMFDAPDSWTTGEGRDYYNYDLDKAKELLAQAGYTGETLTVMYIDQPAITDTMIMMQSNLRDAGINIELLPLEAGTLDTYRSNYGKWDIISDIMGGGNYLANTLKKFWSGDYTDANDNTVLAIRDDKLDELYIAVRDNGSDEATAAFDQYFTYEMCYGIAVARYYEQTACLSTVNAVINSSNMMLPGAFTYND